MSLLESYSANDLFEFLTNREEMLILDVRNEEDFERFNVEGPYPFEMANVPYFDFMEEEEASVAKVSRRQPIKVVCAKEGSAQYVGEILVNHGFNDVGYLTGGIKTWGNMLVPKRLNPLSDEYALYQFIRPGKASCNYGLIYQGEMVIFDPSRNYNFYQSFANSHNAKIVRTFETHLQADYISGSKQIANATGAEIMAHVGDFSNASFQYSEVHDGETFALGDNGPVVKVMHSPGHTPGSTSYIIDDKFFISGDTIFILSVGRPDLGGKAKEWSAMLYDTLTNKVQALDKNLNVLPGHFMKWTEANDQLLFSEKLENIIDQNASVYALDSLGKFTEFIMDNMRKSPEVYNEIRKVNSGWLDVDIDEADIMDLGKNECAAAAYANKD
ncbi:MAG: MBL fold metallo-hydrolase [Candidatus Marinimicrobia bacterium]|nr:MBL fold metallo-hydrolase [Candidatus Neomarinimicrobiota bacterium]MBT5225856.1 MBL fold metallo-hydrolase [Candidatus Neomarinimicrobiota bacterium]